MQRLWLTLAAVAGLLAPAAARGQEVRPPRFEIGGNAAGTIAFLSEDGPVVVGGAGPHVTLNITRRLAIDLLAEVIAPLESSGISALYHTQLDIPVRRSADRKRTLSFTIGGAGLVWYRHVPAFRVPRLDGSAVVYASYRTLQVSAPATAVLGVAREEVVSRRLSTCFAVQTYLGALGGLAVRASAGLSFGVGGYR